MHRDAREHEDEIHPWRTDQRTGPVDERDATFGREQDVVRPQVTMDQRLAMQRCGPSVGKLGEPAPGSAPPMSRPRRPTTPRRPGRRAAATLRSPGRVLKDGRCGDRRGRKQLPQPREGAQDPIQFRPEPRLGRRAAFDVGEQREPPNPRRRRSTATVARERTRAGPRRIRASRRNMSGDSGLRSAATAFAKNRRPSASSSLAARPGENPPAWLCALSTVRAQPLPDGTSHPLPVWQPRKAGCRRTRSAQPSGPRHHLDAGDSPMRP